ncbi:MAG: chaperone modulatory protein CbpM [Gammaproteobacteria bacterium]|nr:chaperone modulatory protein CbpM [Gammaproteobacteria bacterium]MCP5198824.1 chaperone modulatory protein CbpM [Gammaproteobacteria bacterium]
MTDDFTPGAGELLADDRHLTLAELVDASGVRVELIVEMVSHDILRPHGRGAPDWRFPAPALARVRRVVRLRQDLELNWPGVCLALELLDELHDLRRRHRALLRRLG